VRVPAARRSKIASLSPGSRRAERVVEKAAQAIHDGEAEAEPGPARSGTADLIEFAEDVLPLIFRDADAAVPHFDLQRFAAAAAADHDAAALGIATGWKPD